MRPQTKDGAQAVDAYMANLQHPLKAEIEALRALILTADQRIKESVKWNAPSFYIDEHFCTFKLRPEDRIQLVLHTGAKVKGSGAAIRMDDPANLLTWVAADRALVTIADMQDVEAKKTALIAVLRQWIVQTQG